MLTLERITDMLRMQEALEVRIGGKNWREDKHNYPLCIYMECAELIDHLPWKHWKDVDAEPNWEQIGLELIDIWHFALAHILMTSTPSDIDFLGEKLYQDMLDASADVADMDEPLINICTSMSFAVMVEGHFPLGNFILASRCANMDFDQLYLLYACKNVLNVFRQDRGYKAGTYLKVWGGTEDNEHLMEIAEQTNPDEMSFTQLYSALSARYELVVH